MWASREEERRRVAQENENHKAKADKLEAENKELRAKLAAMEEEDDGDDDDAGDDDDDGTNGDDARGEEDTESAAPPKKKPGRPPKG